MYSCYICQLMKELFNYNKCLKTDRSDLTKLLVDLTLIYMGSPRDKDGIVEGNKELS